VCEVPHQPLRRRVRRGGTRSRSRTPPLRDRGRRHRTHVLCPGARAPRGVPRALVPTRRRAAVMRRALASLLAFSLSPAACTGADVVLYRVTRDASLPAVVTDA